MIDNASADGTASICQKDSTVTYLYSDQPYREFKSVWRHVIADALLENCWVLFVDFDELIVYPGWPHVALPDYCAELSGAGFDALFATMIDMYPHSPIDKCRYMPGSPFLEYAPFFDGGNYRLLHRRQKSEYPVPAFVVHGGARERLFFSGRKRNANLLDRWFLRRFLSLQQSPMGENADRILRRIAFSFVRGALPSRPPWMSKIPLLFWRKGTRFSGGVHALKPSYDLAREWGALLHFKYFDDFFDKADEAALREQHTNYGAQYKRYRALRAELACAGLSFDGSVRFDGFDSLVSRQMVRVR